MWSGESRGEMRFADAPSLNSSGMGWTKRAVRPDTMSLIPKDKKSAKRPLSEPEGAGREAGIGKTCTPQRDLLPIADGEPSAETLKKQAGGGEKSGVCVRVVSSSVYLAPHVPAYLGFGIINSSASQGFVS